MKSFALFFLWLFYGVIQSAHACSIKDSTILSSALKLDIVPLYYDFFDTRMQIRTGVEYEKKTKKNIMVTVFMDAGLFDKYVFKKYYDFFNQNQGLYAIEQNISIAGFHLMPSLNYYLFKPKKNNKLIAYGGGIVDINFYRKKFKIYNSRTEIETSNKYSQYRLGVGLDMGVQYSFVSHFFLEFKTSMFVKVFNVVSEKDINPVKPLNAQWNDSDIKYWWVSNFMLGYAF